MDAPDDNKVKIWQNLLSRNILNLPNPQGHVMSVKCEELLDELTVQGWLMYDHPKFYILHSIRWDRITDKQDRQTDR